MSTRAFQTPEPRNEMFWRHLVSYVSGQVPLAFKFVTHDGCGTHSTRLRSEKERRGQRQRQREPGLTFRKAFFSKVFMINGGMAGSRSRPTEIFISCLFSAHIHPPPQQFDKKLVSITFRLFSQWQSETICKNSLKHSRIEKITCFHSLDF